jgi:hypothetical protein
MNVQRAGTQPSGKGPADRFTGAVRIDPLFESAEPARARPGEKRERRAIEALRRP